MIVFLCMLVFSPILPLIQGFECGDNLLVKYKSNGLPKKLPWSVLVKVEKGDNNHYCSGIIVSPTKILTYDCPLDNIEQVSIFMNEKRVTLDIFKINFIQVASQKIQHPFMKKFDAFTLIALKKPIRINKRHAPICLSPTIPERTSNLLYFYWHKIYAQDSSNSIWGTAMELVIEKSLSSPIAAVSYLENGKWYLGAIKIVKRERPSYLDLVSYLNMTELVEYGIRS